ncbi:MAG: periplasmic Cu(I)/Cu(II)-binding protein CopK [Rubrivivax sp.]|nr:periplasmic Cu(I)/Cu(II)-binding protein CopK [Rubrivivax sp.]
MLNKLAIMATLIAAATTAFAVDMANVAKKFDLKDGSTVYVFKDGKMGMEDRLGRVVGMKPGHVMETKDGQRIIMIGNELARLDAIKAAERSGN